MWQNARQRAYLERRRKNRQGRVFLKQLESQFNVNVEEVFGARRLPDQSQEKIKRGGVNEVQLELLFGPKKNEPSS